MATETQSKYIADLVVLKTKEFKEVKELLYSNNIVSADAEIVAAASTIAEITNALTEQQASAFIDVLIATKEPVRGRVYSKRRIESATALVDDIKATIAGWDFS
jgi:transcriptional/translational regulatory protein YebC/TACO1